MSLFTYAFNEKSESMTLVCCETIRHARAMKRIGYIFALSICFASRVLAAPPLPAYGIDIYQTSVSGVSSGGAMAVQMHVAYSSIMRGVGVIAGVAYGCADDPSLLLAAERALRGLSCMDGSVGANFSIQRTTAAAGAIDDPVTNLPPQKVWLFSGYNDGLVRRAAMNAVADYYQHYVDPSNVNPGQIFYQINSHAPHALITNNYGGKCLGSNAKYINNCNYDAARHLLEHIYGQLNPPSSSSSIGSILSFDQGEFVRAVDPTLVPAFIGLADNGYVYVPQACKTETCRVHVVFHGCKQYEGLVGNAVYKHAGYNQWAATNKIIVLYPQTVDNAALNPNGCWDWWGLNDILPRNREFTRKDGYQIAAIKRMLDRLAGGPAHSGGSSGSFGMPQNFSVADSTSSSIALIWQPNSAATGFNVYRSPSSAGPYAKINSRPVAGASFADQGLTANTAYYYQISAVDGSGQESALAGPVHENTAPTPPACDPYYSDNVTHWNKHRADRVGVTKVKAHGSGDPMGRLDPDVSKQLIQVQPDFYRARYCP